MPGRGSYKIYFGTLLFNSDLCLHFSHKITLADKIFFYLVTGNLYKCTVQYRSGFTYRLSLEKGIKNIVQPYIDPELGSGADVFLDIIERLFFILIRNAVYCYFFYDRLVIVNIFCRRAGGNEKNK